VEKMDPSGAPLSMIEESLNTTRESIQQDLVKATVDAAAEMAGSKEAETRLGQVGKQVSRLLAQITALRNDMQHAEQNYSLAYEAVKTASHEYQNASVTVTSKSQDLKQVAPAIVPERPVRPRIVLNTLLGFILGAMLFGALALLIENVREMRHSDLFSLEEVEQVVAKKD